MTAVASDPGLKGLWMNDPGIFVLYRYQPLITLTIVAFILFFISTCVHIVQAWHFRSYYFIPLIVGGVFEWTGYIGRIFSHFDQYALNFYVWQTLFLLLAPTLFAATIYMTLSAVIRATNGEVCSPLRVSWLTRVFICGDVLAFLIQGGGMPPIVACLSQYIGMVSNNGPTVQASILDAGRNVVVSGLVIQIIFFSLFMLTTSMFHYRILHPFQSHPPRLPHIFCRSPTSATSSLTFGKLMYQHQPFPYSQYLYTIYFASILILTRSLFRIVEFVGGHAGSLMTVEWYLYVFDALLMFGVMVSLNVRHPGMIGARDLERRGEAFRLDELERTDLRRTLQLAELPKVARRLQPKSAGRVGHWPRDDSVQYQ